MENDTLLVMIALKNRAAPRQEQVFAHLSEAWPSAPPVTEIVHQEEIVAFQWGEAAASWAFVPAPIPWAELEGACEGSWQWPEATDALRNHQGHVMVSLGSESLDPVEQAILLTQLVASITTTTNTAGVYWASGDVVSSPEMFLKQSQEMSPEALPLLLWIAFRLKDEPDDAITLYTLGMDAFGLMDIEAVEVDWEPEKVLLLAYDLAHYLLENGPVIEDGDVVEGPGKELVTVRYQDSILDPSYQAYSLHVA